MEKILTLNQVAERWNCCSNTVRNEINRGKLRAFRVGERRYGVPISAVEEYESRWATC
ncbi:helix-turn-helix domain-containing protein [Limimaricola sp. AA108-03]|uniref:helix-turn-helix domain-containing protein n=1 Tax=Limimaricola sp. AA108-03 TaxID=3425945 RepID=UPI003D77A4C8